MKHDFAVFKAVVCPERGTREMAFRFMYSNAVIPLAIQVCSPFFCVKFDIVAWRCSNLPRSGNVLCEFRRKLFVSSEFLIEIQHLVFKMTTMLVILKIHELGITLCGPWLTILR